MKPTLHDAVRLIYNNAISISGNDVNSLIVLDQNNSPLQINAENVNTEFTNLQNNYELSQIKQQAQTLLSNTDWTEIPSVINTANNPHLINSSDFITYRLALRLIALNPTLNPVWPTLPTEQWSQK